MQNRIDWPEHLLRGMWRTQKAESTESAYSELSALLMGLGDPYTRIVPGRSDSSCCVACSKTASRRLVRVAFQEQSTHANLMYCSVFEDYQSSSEGELQGVGLLLATDHASKRLVVIAPIGSGPAHSEPASSEETWLRSLTDSARTT